MLKSDFNTNEIMLEYCLLRCEKVLYTVNE